LVSDQPAALTQSCALVLGNARQASGHGALAGLVQGNDCSPHIQTDHKSLRSETWKFVMLVKTKWPTSASFVPKQY